MATDKNTLKKWFRTGLKPMQNHFWNWLDSYWHKDEKIPLANIDGMDKALENKAETTALAEKANIDGSGLGAENIIKWKEVLGMEKFATIDKGNELGNTYTKEQIEKIAVMKPLGPELYFDDEKPNMSDGQLLVSFDNQRYLAVSFNDAMHEYVKKSEISGSKTRRIVLSQDYKNQNTDYQDIPEWELNLSAGKSYRIKAVLDCDKLPINGSNNNAVAEFGFYQKADLGRDFEHGWMGSMTFINIGIGRTGRDTGLKSPLNSAATRTHRILFSEMVISPDLDGVLAFSNRLKTAGVSEFSIYKGSFLEIEEL